MELYEANRILRTVKAAAAADGFKLPSSAETDGLMMLLGKLDAGKYLAHKIKHARSQASSSSAFNRSYKLIMFFRALQAVSKDLPDPLTAMSMMMLHKTIMGDLDGNAGKFRTTEVYTDGNAHTDPKYIAGSVKSIIAKMNETGSAPMTAKEDFAGYLSHYMRELIILHPFERGSEFTLRIFLAMFCKQKGFSLGYYRATPPAIKSAEDKAFATDNVAPLYSLFAECLMYDHKTTQASPTTQLRTRREVAKDLCRPNRPAPPPTPAAPPQQDQAEQRQQQQQHKTENNDQNGTAVKVKKPKDPSNDDDVIKRAIRLQQKISKLNEQLTELIKPLETNDTDE